MRVEFNEIAIDLIPTAQIVETIFGWFQNPNRSYQVVTLNTLMMVRASRDQGFKNLIGRADLVLVDSYGIEAALRQYGFADVNRIAGIDLVRELFNWSSLTGVTVYCYGGPPQLSEGLRAALKTNWPKLSLAGIRDGYQATVSQDQVIAEIRNTQPGLLLVGLGVPKQEQFLAEVLPGLKGTVGIGVGGALEVIAGRRREAPKTLRSLGWEWLYRMIQDPVRFKHLPDLVRFWIHHILLNKKRGEKIG